MVEIVYVKVKLLFHDRFQVRSRVTLYARTGTVQLSISLHRNLPGFYQKISLQPQIQIDSLPVQGPKMNHDDLISVHIIYKAVKSNL